ncbi:MAG: hypothetical protein GKS06_17530 [Acidobacteria bacterium]|nr:hypothetical protein [Acidobacteriota bacterium]
MALDNDENGTESPEEITSEEATTAESPVPAEGPPSPPPPAPDPTPTAAPEVDAGPREKADVGKRVLAALIDCGIAIVMAFVPGVGQLLGSAYMILRDGLDLDFMNHRSIGKQVMKLHVETVDGAPLELMTSVKRNWIFAIGPLVPLVFIIPLLGLLLFPFLAFASLALGITELVPALTDAEGRRLGDKWANTIVVED